jgi:hypothetical protein
MSDLIVFDLPKTILCLMEISKDKVVIKTVISSHKSKEILNLGRKAKLRLEEISL